MKKILLAILFLLISIPAHALSLRWDAVTTDSTGATLGAGLAVTQYRIYKCNTPATSCLKAAATLLGTVNAPNTTFNIDAQAFPASFFVTAVNIVQESPESGTVKVVPPDKPKNEGLQTP
jgi:hypothetical protein